MTLAYSRMKKKRRRHQWPPEDGPWYSNHAWAKRQRFLAKLRIRWSKKPSH